MNDVFKRYEKKYLLTRVQYDRLRDRLQEFMQVDQYGEHTISNIYFDTDNYALIRQSLEKPIYKEKLRLRAYGTPEDGKSAFIEIKKKFDGIVYKRRVEMMLKEANRYLFEGVKPSSVSNHFNKNQIFQEIDYMFHRYDLVPKAYIAYDRLALFGIEDPELRVTFDERIRGRNVDFRFAEKNSDYRITTGNQILMEVKIAGAMPLWMVHIFTDLGILCTSFSKYGEYYKKILRFEDPKSPSAQPDIHHAA